MPEGTAGKAFTVSTGPLPSSRKIHVAGDIHPEIRVAMREIDLDPSAGEPPVRVYDPSGVYTDNSVAVDVEKGLKALRAAWIVGRARCRGI